MPFKSADVQKVYQNDPKLKSEDVKNLLNWAEKQPHLPKISELQAILFLQSCFYSNEAAKNTIDTFFTVRTICPEIFTVRNPNDAALKNAMNVSLTTALPRLTPEGYLVMFGKLVDCNPDKYHFVTQLKYFDMNAMLQLNLNGPYKGVVMVMDMEGSVFGHLTKVGVITVKKFMYYLQEAMPIRLKGVHYINVAPFTDKLLALVKPFLKKDMIDLIQIHADSITTLYKYVPQECLPQEYGGKCESLPILHEKAKAAFFDNIDFFLQEEKQLVDESKRQGKPKNAGDFFGIEGTFKKLELD